MTRREKSLYVMYAATSFWLRISNGRGRLIRSRCHAQGVVVVLLRQCATLFIYRLVGGTWEAEVGMPREMPKVTNKAETYRSPLLWRITP